MHLDILMLGCVVAVARWTVGREIGGLKIDLLNVGLCACIVSLTVYDA